MIMPIYEQPTVPEEAGKNADVVERVEYKNGIQVFLRGHEYPFKGMPTEAAVNAIAIIKKLLKLQPLEAMWAAIQPHILKTEYQMAITQELCKMFPNRLGILVAHVIEYDSSYRLRLQDLSSETTKKSLLSHPLREIRRLIAINKRRDYAVAHRKIRGTLLVILCLLYIPSVRKKLRECNFTKLQCDDNDKYWLSKRTDYNWNA